ncbi:MAG: GTPase HflX [Thermoanaerobaculia bacterium]
MLVGLALPDEPVELVEDHLDELEALTLSAGPEVAARSVQRRRRPVPATFIGRGKAEELAAAAAELGVDLVIFDQDLTPSQVKNLEEILDAQVLDRSGLILEIFHQRARSREARTQVELAQLEYLLPRLTRRWGHLSRQVGGIGVRGGEGETQLEADRRVLRDRIRKLKKDLAHIERTREVQRRGRRGVQTVAMAGYTNAGKSTLFNALTRADTYVQHRLFATLDSKLRQGALAPDKVVVFADTVGFIRKLPHHLVASFRSTLEEVTEADQVLHVVDRAHPQWREQRRVGEEVLAGLGVTPERVLTVYNKRDLWNGTGIATPEENAVAVSATTGAGLDTLKRALAERLTAAPLKS